MNRRVLESVDITGLANVLTCSNNCFRECVSTFCHFKTLSDKLFWHAYECWFCIIWLLCKFHNCNCICL